MLENLSKNLTLAALMMVSVVAKADDTLLRAQLDRYLNTVVILKASLADDVPLDVPAIAANVDLMLADAKPLLLAYAARHACTQDLTRQVNKIIELYPQIETWSSHDIMHFIEAGRMVPVPNLCGSAARSMVARPAMVRADVRLAAGSLNRYELRSGLHTAEYGVKQEILRELFGE